MSAMGYGIGKGAGYLASMLRRRRENKEDELRKGRVSDQDSQRRMGEQTLMSKMRAKQDQADPIYQENLKQTKYQTEQLGGPKDPSVIKAGQLGQREAEQARLTANDTERREKEAKKNEAAKTEVQRVGEAEKSFSADWTSGKYKEDADLFYQYAVVELGLNAENSTVFKAWEKGPYKQYQIKKAKQDSAGNVIVPEEDEKPTPPVVAKTDEGGGGLGGMVSGATDAIGNFFGASADTTDTTATPAVDKPYQAPGTQPEGFIGGMKTEEQIEEGAAAGKAAADEPTEEQKAAREKASLDNAMGKTFTVVEDGKKTTIRVRNRQDAERVLKLLREEKVRQEQANLGAQ